MNPLLPNFNRRHFLAAAGASSLAWLTPLGTALARAAEKDRAPAKSVVVLWMGGGPSQLETFDPKPGTDIAAGTKAINTSVKGVQLAAGLEQLAEQMQHVALVRSLWSKEGDHERGTYALKTGYRPDATVAHPSLGAIVCHDLPNKNVDIPRHVSIMPNEWPARGGVLGAQFDAFKVHDPKDGVPDVTPHVSPERFEQRLEDLKVVEEAFARGRGKRVEATGHKDTMDRARKMMSSDQLKAFDVSREPGAVRKEYGDTPFGRGCLAARRLIELGVRCVEVTLAGWDSHANNHDITTRLKGELDPAFAALIRDLANRGTLKDTVVLCVGEFGRTPQLNALGGRDHWPHNFTAALAGGGIKGGTVVGESDPAGGKEPKDKHPAANLHATVLKALGIDWEKTFRSPIGRTFARSEGTPIDAILS
ncbi:hypothetical protein VT84_08885 [Gemmata sp. SH-PL17]|uniref:DUF1501 domain-containing protein n=1 Tax=Gemmata sp. SH-PL17 TaxID=1630693 RepID=UPI0004B0766F|nr:DUF1501 domain-containing protein [Gemmata sp. SH-PL17]AMV24499.1 hypothetical protein VT84_08885 [Gemmata sp. SH-PL17]